MLLPRQADAAGHPQGVAKRRQRTGAVEAEARHMEDVVLIDDADILRPNARLGIQDISKAGAIRPWHRLSAQRMKRHNAGNRSEEHTSELQSLMRISYAVFCLKKKTTKS